MVLVLLRILLIVSLNITIPCGRV